MSRGKSQRDKIAPRLDGVDRVDEPPSLLLHSPSDHKESTEGRNGSEEAELPAGRRRSKSARVGVGQATQAEGGASTLRPHTSPARPAVSTRKMHPLLPIKDKPPDGSREEQDAASDEGSRPFGPSEPRVKGDSQKGDAVDERVRRRGLPRLEELRCDSGHVFLKSVGAKSSTDDARAGDEGAGAPES